MSNLKDKPEEKQFTRRPPGKLLFQPPTPRPIPADHPAKVLFSSLPRETPQEDSAATATETPIATPTEAATTTPTVTQIPASKIDAPSSPPRRAPQAAGVPVPDDTPRRSEALDATHTSSEQLVYNFMYRETISRGIRERHFGPKELLAATPIRSHVTVRKAIDGLIAKLSIEIVSNVFGSPFGPRYRIYEPREVARRRAAAGIYIDPGSKRIEPAVTPTETPIDTTTVSTTDTPTVTATATPTTPTVTPTNTVGATATTFGGVTPTSSVGVFLNKENSGRGENSASAASSSKSGAVGDDDGAFSGLIKKLRAAVLEATGREPSAADAERWNELGDLLVGELRSASERTQISSTPAFLAEHLRRRLRRPDAGQTGQDSASVATGKGVVSQEKPELTHEEIEEQAGLIASLMIGGASIGELEEQFAANFRPAQWLQIRSIASAQRGYSRPGPAAQQPDDGDQS